MKLQVKDSGAWRNVIEFHAADIATVEKSATSLLRIGGNPKVSMRIIEDERAIGYCECENGWSWRRVAPVG